VLRAHPLVQRVKISNKDTKKVIIKKKNLCGIHDGKTLYLDKVELNHKVAMHMQKEKRSKKKKKDRWRATRRRKAHKQSVKLR